MADLIERVAREIARAASLREGKEPATADGFSDAIWQDYVPAAHAVMVAIRIPTDKMSSAGELAPLSALTSVYAQDCASIFTAMIDQAVLEHPR